MIPSDPPSPAILDFITRWEASGAGERANYQLFLSELCDLLGVPRPEPSRPDDRDNAYVFERSVTFYHGDGSASTGRIDLYKRGCFVLEAKQGSVRSDVSPLMVKETEAGWLTSSRKGTAVRGTMGWDDAMLKAKGQAEQYARALPLSEGWPPLLIIVDVGHSIEMYAEFSCSGKIYLPFPDPRSHRLKLADLVNPEVRDRLRSAWTEPRTLDPARRTARVTREVAERLARLAKSLEQAGETPDRVASFLKRCLFTMFAEDVGLIPRNSFSALLASLKGEVDKFPPLVASLWETMKTGGFSPVLREKLLRFNGGLFEEAEVLSLTEEQLALLCDAGKADWRDVEPAIFGTLLERALDPRERHHLGAHYTPRDYVERLVLATVIEPLRAEWEAVLAAAVTLANQGALAEAVAEIKAFHRRLCAIRILDPACGCGNFLYVTFEHLKRLEGELFNALEEFGETQTVLDLAGSVVDPHQLLGIEINQRAAAITDMVLWIGYLQWHFRTRGNLLPPEPVIKALRNIECRDAVLAYDGTEPVRDEQGNPVTRWDGVTTKPHPVTGEAVPDETARTPLLRYLNPRKADWPEADFVVGNPPFIGNKRLRQALGDGYVDALRKAHADMPESCDLVMYWWAQAAELTRTGKLRAFGLITTNSLTQTFNRSVIQTHLTASPPLSLTFAVPDHPWVDAADGAAVRIAMSAAVSGDREGKLCRVVEERSGPGEGVEVRLEMTTGKIFADLKVGANVAGAAPLAANLGISNRGVIPHGAGFIVTEAEASGFGDSDIRSRLPLYLNGRDVMQRPRGVRVIDLFGLGEADVRDRFPEVYQWLLERVKPERDQNPRKSRRENWWLFAENQPKMRESIRGLRRYIVTVYVSKHRIFTFLDQGILADDGLIVIGLDDGYELGVLSSRIHLIWALAAGGRLGVGNDPRYNKSQCFETFPFPDCDEQQQVRIRELGEALDAHRKRRQALFPNLTLTDMYNVLEKLREMQIPLNPPFSKGDLNLNPTLTKGGVSEASRGILSAKEMTIHEQGLISVLARLHDELDAAVCAAYGWPGDLSDDGILERIVALNRERTAEEARGVVRLLRPGLQNPTGTVGLVQSGLGLEESSSPADSRGAEISGRHPWPRTLPEQVRAVRAVLAVASGPLTAREVARTFQRAREDKVLELLTTLAALGQAREVSPGMFIG